VLLEAAAALRCTPLHRLPVGDSTVVVASVVDVILGPDGGRLLYHDGRFVT